MINNTFNEISNSFNPTTIFNSIIENGQNELFFHLNFLKANRITNFKSKFNRESITNLFISNHISGFRFTTECINVNFLELDFFINQDDKKFGDLVEKLRGSIVILNNNDLNSQVRRNHYSKFYELCQDTLFIAWDWDNHHWLDLSVFLASHSDLYAPAHNENLYLLTRYNWLTIGPIYCSTVQWSEQFLSRNLKEMLCVTRSNDPLGMHVMYERFKFRNQIITTLHNSYPNIGFVSTRYHNETAEKRFIEWCAHKLHWIAPTLNDVPIRIFDALITGGIPIIPESLRFLSPIAQIPNQFVGFYSASDIVNPNQLIDKLIQKFDKAGDKGIASRHQYAISHHHANASIERMVKNALELIK